MYRGINTCSQQKHTHTPLYCLSKATLNIDHAQHRKTMVAVQPFSSTSNDTIAHMPFEKHNRKETNEIYQNHTVFV